MHVCYTDFDLEDWEIIIDTIHLISINFGFVYSMHENHILNGSPAIIGFY